MSSPFLRNRQRRLGEIAGATAAKTGAQPIDETTEAGQEYAALRVVLHDQLRQLADTESVEARAPLKAEFRKAFADWIDGVIAADAPVQDEIVMTCLVWAIDVGDFDEAVRLGEFALRHGLQMPDRYKRSVACFLREDIAEVELTEPGSVDLRLMVQIDELTQGADMPDAAKAKLHKAMGRAWRAKAETFDPTDDTAPAGGKAGFMQEALTQLQRALKLDQKAGVKKDIEQLQRDLKKLAAEAEQNTAGQSGE